MACPAIVVLVTDLVFGRPLAKADHQHSKLRLVRPESVFLARLDHELIMFRRAMDVSLLSMGALKPATNVRVKTSH